MDADNEIFSENNQKIRISNIDVEKEEANIMSNKWDQSTVGTSSVPDENSVRYADGLGSNHLRDVPETGTSTTVNDSLDAYEKEPTEPQLQARTKFPFRNAESVININPCNQSPDESFPEPNKVAQDHISCDRLPPNLVHAGNGTASEARTDHPVQIENAGCPDTLSILARSYEDTEPVYLSGIVDHITRSGECQFDSDPRSAGENENVLDHQDEKELSVTDLLSNESISDEFDKVYVMNTERRNSSEIDLVQSLQTTYNDSENELTSSSTGSGYSEVDGALKMRTVKSSLKRPSNDGIGGRETPLKKARRGITFDSVSVYYFPRTQGFTCIPSQGGSTLGMSWNHSHSRKFSLGEHVAEQRRAHKQYCLQQFNNAVKNWNEVSNMSSDDSDSDEVISDSDMEFENYNFLQPIPTRERRAMLRAAGVHKIDSGEKDECRSIRSSREFCGCTCEIYCDPDRCVCAQAGIKCQVDRMNFPCSCTRDGCANENGRIEFNPVRVRTHYIHTLMRLEMEKKQEEEDEQRGQSLVSGAESSSRLAYSSSSSSSPLNINSNLMNFSYHTNLQTWAGEYEGSIPSAANCFNFGGYAASSDHFNLNSMIENQYHQSISRLAVAGTSPPASVQYCGQLSSEESDECSRMLHYGDMNSSVLEMDQSFLLHDLTNSSKSNESEVAYDAGSLMRVADKNFEPQIDSASQSEGLDTSAEASEETEKEESDSENFGDIIKKTMVESVIA